MNAVKVDKIAHWACFRPYLEASDMAYMTITLDEAVKLYGADLTDRISGPPNGHYKWTVSLNEQKDRKIHLGGWDFDRTVYELNVVDLTQKEQYEVERIRKQLNSLLFIHKANGSRSVCTLKHKELFITAGNPHKWMRIGDDHIEKLVLSGVTDRATEADRRYTWAVIAERRSSTGKLMLGAWCNDLVVTPITEKDITDVSEREHMACFGYLLDNLPEPVVRMKLGEAKRGQLITVSGHNAIALTVQDSRILHELGVSGHSRNDSQWVWAAFLESNEMCGWLHNHNAATLCEETLPKEHAERLAILRRYLGIVVEPRKGDTPEERFYQDRLAKAKSLSAPVPMAKPVEKLVNYVTQKDNKYIADRLCTGDRLIKSLATVAVDIAWLNQHGYPLILNKADFVTFQPALDKLNKAIKKGKK